MKKHIKFYELSIILRRYCSICIFQSLKNGQKPAPAHVRPLETWSENMTPDFEFFPPSHLGKLSKELQSSDSEVFRRLPEETLDVASVPSNIGVAKKSSLIQKSGLHNVLAYILP